MKVDESTLNLERPETEAVNTTLRHYEEMAA